MAPPQGQMRPGRQLVALGIIFAILYALVFLGGKGGFSSRLNPKLGLDLVGGTRVTLIAKTLDGKAPKADSLEQARRIIQSRVDSRGVSEAEVVTEGNQNIVISVPGQSNDAVKDVGQAAQLRFRKVLNLTQDIGDTTTPTATPSASATPSSSASASAKASASATPKASATPSATATTSPTAAATTAAPSASPTAAPPPGQADVKAKVGAAAWQAASALTAPFDPGADAAEAAVLAPFKTLTGPEVSALPVA
ncbi:MAG TPA: protein translocase subunit SecD, partial [Micromonosporaceae bacterium]|nr:protein translocase subunit SecD [Micromonosporaceae bacterium]